MTPKTDRLHAAAPWMGWILIALAIVLVFAMAMVAVAQNYTDGRRFGPVRAVHRERGGSLRSLHRGSGSA